MRDFNEDLIACIKLCNFLEEVNLLDIQINLQNIISKYLVI